MRHDFAARGFGHRQHESSRARTTIASTTAGAALPSSGTTRDARQTRCRARARRSALSAAAARCSRARRRRPGGPAFAAFGSASCSHAVPGEPGMTRSSALRSGASDVLVRVEHERVARRRRIRRPCAEQARQMTADAGWFAAELAGVNADAHFDCERSTVRRRVRARDAGARAGRPRRRAARRAPSGSM